MLQYTCPVTNGASSPLTAASAASSIDGETLYDVAPLHERHAPEHHARGLYVSISQPLADLGGPACELDGLVEVPGLQRPQRLSAVEVAVLGPLRLRLQVSRRPVEPSGGRRARELRAVLARQGERDERGPRVVVRPDEAGVGPFEHVDGVVGTHGPPRRLRHGLESSGPSLTDASASSNSSSPRSHSRRATASRAAASASSVVVLMVR